MTAKSVTFVGDGLELVLSVDGYEFEVAEGWDRDWLNGSVRLGLEDRDGSFEARVSVFWRADELARFEEQLRSGSPARKSRTSRVAELTTLEDQVELQIEVRLGEAQICGRVETERGGIELGWVATTAEQLEAALGQLAKLTQRFPARTGDDAEADGS
jgi:hypothetical protein